MAQVVIYSTDNCGYCDAAMALLDRYTVQPTVFKVDSDPALLAEMLAKSGGRRSVPQIFIDGVHVGGYDDLRAAAASGELAKLLGSAS